MPATTTASTPLTWSASAGMNAITGTSSENTMPRSESWIRVWNTPAIRATTSPTTMPPTATTTRSVAGADRR